jgi:hypothetical protein
MSMVAGVAIVASALFPGVLRAGATSIPDVGGAGVFELDGNIAQDTATPPPYDWQCVFNTPAHTGCPPSSALMPAKTFQPDFGNPDPTYFSGVGAGIKDINDIPTWGCVTLNNPLNKDDILNAYGAVFIPTSGAKQGHVLVYLAQERDSNNGDSFAGFWLMHNQHACDSSAAGTFNGKHDPGDLLVVSNYTNGGTTATVQLWSWDTSATNNLVQLGNGFTCGQTPPPGIASPDDMCAIANAGNVTQPWAPHNTLGANQFVEVGVDLSDLLPPTLTGQTACFSDFLAETRSSQELTATLKDYTTGRFDICVNPTVSTQQTAGGHTAAAQTILAGSSVSDQATLSGAILGTPGGSIEYVLSSGTDCKGTVVYDSGQLPLQNGVVPPSASVPLSTVGQYEWQAFYSGDTSSGGRNRAGQSTCGDEPLVVVDANIGITPVTAVNAVNDQHTFDVSANALAPAGQTVSFAAIATTLTNTLGPAAQVISNTCGTPTVNGYTASCAVTIDSATSATYTLDASDVITINGLQITRSTAQGANHGPGGTGTATKNYVDASVAIGPHTATNAIGAPHQFTITANAYPGGTGVPSWNSITTSVTPTPTTMSTTCGSPVISNGGDTATCTLTINSSTATTYTANASISVTMGTVTVLRTTAPDGSQAGPNGTGPATKIYGAPSIAIAPSAVNEVGHPHTFTVTVTTVPGTTTTFGSITPSVVPAPDSMSSTCGTPVLSGNTATCTVTIDSSTAGVFIANASAVLTISGFQTTVSTTVPAQTTTGAATKTYVDASIAINPPAAVNEVGVEHTFTITVKGFPQDSPAASFANIVPSINQTPDLEYDVSSCASPTVSGNTATCQVKIRSSTAGHFVLNASADVTMGGVTMHRTTAPDGSQAGPGGSGPATKDYVDAAIGIGPSASNEVGHQHVFTIVVTALPGGVTTAPTFKSITTSVAPQPMDSSDTCATPVISGDGLTATCTLTIDNDLPATFTADATAVVSIGGVDLTRSTAAGANHGPGGTPSATKTYVTATIGLSPLSANDPVGDLHTLTATVTTDNGSGDSTQPAAAPDGTVVDFSIVSGPGSLASPSCTVSNGLGTCTDVLTSDVAGTTVVQATTTVVVNGVTLVRTTGDSVPGDSANAVKVWHKVQPTITTTQSAGGTIGVAASDTAKVAGGLNPSGTVSFSLFGPTDTTCTGTPVFISANQPLSNGSAASGSFTPTATGTYHWVATYSGDAANLTAASGCGDEPVTIVAAAVQAITAPNTGAGIVSALAEGMALMLAGAGLLAAGNRRRRTER